MDYYCVWDIILLEPQIINTTHSTAILIVSQRLMIRSELLHPLMFNIICSISYFITTWSAVLESEYCKTGPYRLFYPNNVWNESQFIEDWQIHIFIYHSKSLPVSITIFYCLRWNWVTIYAWNQCQTSGFADIL